MKKCSTSLAIKKMQIKMTLRFTLILIRMAVMKNTRTNAGKMWGKRISYALFVLMKVSPTTMEISMEVLQKTKSKTTI
jgi:hypothetical protein